MAYGQKTGTNGGAVQGGGNGEGRQHAAQRLMPQRLYAGLAAAAPLALDYYSGPRPVLTREEACSFVPKKLSLGLRALNFLFAPLFKTWVAGTRLEDAVREVKKLNARFENAGAIINFLGEHYKSTVQVKRAMFEYYNAIDAIAEEGLRSSVSIKPSQFGFDVQDFQGSEQEKLEWCYANMRAIVEYAKSKNVIVWFDMESHVYTHFTLAAYRRLLREFDNVGIVLQANMRMSMQDLNDLLGLPRYVFFAPKIRLCKGIYKEPEKIAFQTRAAVDDNMHALQEHLYVNAPSGVWRVTASHDEKFLRNGQRLSQGCSGETICTSQMLRGVRPKLFEEIASTGECVEVYTPYGPDMLPYSVRRGRESPQLRGVIVRSLLDWFYKRNYGH